MNLAEQTGKEAVIVNAYAEAVSTLADKGVSYVSLPTTELMLTGLAMRQLRRVRAQCHSRDWAG